MKKSLLTLSFGILLTITTITGCNKPAPSDTIPELKNFNMEEFKQKKITVPFWHTMGKSNMALVDKMKTAFNREFPNITIEHFNQGGYGDILGKIENAIPAKTTPVMAYAYPDHVATYISKGATLELNQFIDHKDLGFGENGTKDFISGFWKEGTAYDTKETVYSVPFSKSTEALFYNETALKNWGFVDGDGKVIVPTKWENEADPNDYTAIINLARAIKKKDPTITPIGYDSDDNLFITFCEQLKIPYTSIKEVNGKIRGSNDFVNVKALEMVKKVKSWYDEKLIVTKGTTEDGSYTSTLFKNQKLVFTIGSTGGTTYNEPNLDGEGKPQFNALVSPIPQWDASNKKVISQGPSITFFKNSKITGDQQIAAWLFYKFTTNAENSAAFSIETGYEPVRVSSYETEDYKNHLARMGTKDETLKVRVSHAMTSIKGGENEASWYFTSPAFQGSASSREQVGGIITGALKLTSTGTTLENQIKKIFEDALVNANFTLPTN